MYVKVHYQQKKKKKKGKEKTKTDHLSPLQVPDQLIEKSTQPKDATNIFSLMRTPTQEAIDLNGTDPPIEDVSRTKVMIRSINSSSDFLQREGRAIISKKDGLLS